MSRLRAALGAQLTGDVLEVGPGNQPFPTGPGARIVYADRSVPGGRDATWPELVGEPHGPQADIEVDLDHGMGDVADASFDAVIASHVIEHVANPIATIQELVRVLRPGGRLLLVVPDRGRTFDAVRVPTPFAHLMAEHAGGVDRVDDDHIREFCEAIFSQPSMHPLVVREWHDPANLDAELFDLHRRRSIHAHCWAPEEFAALLVGVVASGLLGIRLLDVYFGDDLEDEPSIEFGLLVESVTDDAAPMDLARRVARDWTALVLDDERRSVDRVVAFAVALAQALGDDARLAPLAGVPTEVLAERRADLRQEVSSLRDRLAAAEAAALDAEQRRDACQQQIDVVVGSTTFRAGRVVTAPLRLARRAVGR